jgi:DNA-binding LacI/PurR family transcriptional regulator
MVRKLYDFEVTRVAAQALCKRETVRAFLTRPGRMRPATRARIEVALRTLGYDVEEPYVSAHRTLRSGKS